MLTLPHTLFTLTLTSGGMAALGPTIWLFLTLVLFMVVTSTRLPAAAPSTETSLPAVSMLPDRSEKDVWVETWLLLIWLPTPPWELSFQVPVVWPKSSAESPAQAYV